MSFNPPDVDEPPQQAQEDDLQQWEPRREPPIPRPREKTRPARRCRPEEDDIGLCRVGREFQELIDIGMTSAAAFHDVMLTIWTKALNRPPQTELRWDMVAMQLTEALDNARFLMGIYQWELATDGGGGRDIDAVITLPCTWLDMLLDQCRVGCGGSPRLRRALVEWAILVFLEPMLNPDPETPNGFAALLDWLNEPQQSSVSARIAANTAAALLDRIDALFAAADVVDVPSKLERVASDCSYFRPLRQLATELDRLAEPRQKRGRHFEHCRACQLPILSDKDMGAIWCTNATCTAIGMYEPEKNGRKIE